MWPFKKRSMRETHFITSHIGETDSARKMVDDALKEHVRSRHDRRCPLCGSGVEKTERMSVDYTTDWYMRHPDAVPEVSNLTTFECGSTRLTGTSAAEFVARCLVVES